MAGKPEQSSSTSVPNVRAVVPFLLLHMKGFFGGWLVYAVFFLACSRPMASQVVESCREEMANPPSVFPVGDSVLLQHEVVKRKYVAAESCTATDEDPYATGNLVECCNGLTRKIGKWTTERSDWFWLCKPQSTRIAGSAVEKDVKSMSLSQSMVVTKIMEWNVHWNNKDTPAIANIVHDNRPDVVGLCELTTSMEDMSAALSTATGRSFKTQPGRGAWVGYGTDIFYDTDKWLALDGGVTKGSCAGSRGGPRAVNWVVLKDHTTGKILITGGTHTSYCAEDCDALHACELGNMYNKFIEMKGKYNNAPVVWMGDTNRAVGTKVMQDMLNGIIGGFSTFQSEDLAKTAINTYFSGGPAIDHIIGERDAFTVKEGGATGQGVRGQYLNGADHFPIFAKLLW